MGKACPFNDSSLHNYELETPEVDLKRVARSDLLRISKRAKATWFKAVLRDEMKRKKSHLRGMPRTQSRFGGRRETRIVPPSNFSFSQNYSETVACLQRLKTAVFRDSAGQGLRSSTFIDIAEIETISVSGALVLAAEIDRWRQFAGRPMRPRNAAKWHPEVSAMLRELGFFKLLDVDPSNIPSRKNHRGEGSITVLPMISNTELDQRLLASLSQISEALHGDPTIYGALVEAAYNVGKHAYPTDFQWKFPPIIKGWWATASLDPIRACVKFIVYDQGVGIAQTLPRWEGWEKVRGILALLPFKVGESLNDESNMIKAALEVDRTSLSGGHGKGLQDIVSVVQGFADAEVRILSGYGSILYRKDKTLILKDEPLHVGGTLIEWTIPLHVQ